MAKLATESIQKGTPVLTNFNDLLEQPEVLMLHGSVTSAAVALRDSLTDHVTKANEVMTNGCAELHSGITNIKDLTALLTEVKKTSTMMSQLVDNIFRVKSGMGS